MSSIASNSEPAPRKRRRYIKKRKKKTPAWVKKTLLGFLGLLVLVMVGSLVFVAMTAPNEPLDELAAKK
ncbi:hypothetical protein [Hymenobacter guriensis]|uniref:hypothetical protein n=1 Tax=Hymenobacter guriensis TaxID=2793065 RepID=UPI001E3243E3|nr:hypothetical protein [Hymenobacter guriensis]